MLWSVFWTLAITSAFDLFHLLSDKDLNQDPMHVMPHSTKDIYLEVVLPVSWLDQWRARHANEWGGSAYFATGCSLNFAWSQRDLKFKIFSCVLPAPSPFYATFVALCLEVSLWSNQKQLPVRLSTHSQNAHVCITGSILFGLVAHDITSQPYKLPISMSLPWKSCWPHRYPDFPLPWRYVHDGHSFAKWIRNICRIAIISLRSDCTCNT